MTDTGTTALPWVPLAERRPQFSAYEVNHDGRIRSVNRVDRLGRNVKGGELKPRVSGTSPYPKVTLYPTGEGKPVDFTVGQLVLLVYVGECPEGQEILHLDDNPLNNRLDNLAYGTHDLNVYQRMRNRPAQPKPVKVCVRCGTEFDTSGRRCHPCVVQIGEQAADYLAQGNGLAKVAEALEYPSLDGVWTLARKYGGAVVILRSELDEINRQLREMQSPPQPSWSRRVTTTLRARFRRGDAA